MNYFIEFFLGQHPDFPLNTRESPYFRLIQKLQAGNEVKLIEYIYLFI